MNWSSSHILHFVATLLLTFAVGVAATATEPLVLRGDLDCSGAVEVDLNTFYYGDNTGLPNNVSYYGCSGQYEPGGEYVFHLHLDFPVVLNAYITTDACAQDLILLSQCDEDLGCVGVFANQFTEILTEGDYYIVVDGQECGFDILFEQLFVPWPCLTSWPLSCVDQELSGTTCIYDNSVTDLDCASQPQPGWDYWYELHLTDGEGFSTTITMADDDVALWVLATCAFPPYVCNAFVDQNGYGLSETLHYTNHSGAAETIFLIVDSDEPGGCADYTGTFNCIAPIGVEGLSWGILKDRYR